MSTAPGNTKCGLLVDVLLIIDDSMGQLLNMRRK